MPAMSLLATLRRFLRIQSELGTSGLECPALKSASDQTLGLALQASLRQQLNDWVHAPNTVTLGRQLTQAQVLLTEARRRQDTDNFTLDRMLRQPRGQDEHQAADVSLAHVRALSSKTVAKLSKWNALTYAAAHKQAAPLATFLQDTVASLLEFAGRADHTDPRQVDWIALVANTHTIKPGCDAHSSAVIGAACWMLAGQSRLRDWQLLAWRLWSMNGDQLATYLSPGRRWPIGQSALTSDRHLRDILLQAGVLRQSVDGHYHRKARINALKSALVILQTVRYDIEEAAKREMQLPG